MKVSYIFGRFRLPWIIIDLEKSKHLIILVMIKFKNFVFEGFCMVCCCTIHFSYYSISGTSTYNASSIVRFTTGSSTLSI